MTIKKTLFLKIDWRLLCKFIVYLEMEHELQTAEMFVVSQNNIPISEMGSKTVANVFGWVVKYLKEAIDKSVEPVQTMDTVHRGDFDFDHSNTRVLIKRVEPRSRVTLRRPGLRIRKRNCVVRLYYKIEIRRAHCQ